MNGMERFVLDYILNSVWQVPLLFVAAWVAARVVRRLGAQAEHRVWVGALFAAVLVPACRLSWLPGIGSVFQGGRGVSRTDARIELVTSLVDTGGALRFSPALQQAVVEAYLAAMLYLLGRLLWAMWGSVALRRESGPVHLHPEAARSWERICGYFGVFDAGLGSSAQISGPITLGVWRRLLLVPPEFIASADPGDLEAALAHEFAHMRRRDWGKNVLYEVLSLPVAFHPVVSLMKSQVAQTRELVCDALAAESMGANREYARSLLRLASMMSGRTPAITNYAIGIFDANILERRVMNLLMKQTEAKRSVRLAAGAVCVLLGVAACGTAMALRMEVKAPRETAARTKDQQTKDNAEFVAPKLISHRQPEYPAAAKSDQIQGAVIVGVTIGEDGLPTDIHLVKSVRADLDQSALDAIKEWRYSPATKGGTPVATDMKIEVTFSLFP